VKGGAVACRIGVGGGRWVSGQEGGGEVVVNDGVLVVVVVVVVVDCDGGPRVCGYDVVEEMMTVAI